MTVQPVERLNWKNVRNRQTDFRAVLIEVALFVGVQTRCPICPAAIHPKHTNQESGCVGRIWL